MDVWKKSISYTWSQDMWWLQKESSTDTIPWTESFLSLVSGKEDSSRLEEELFHQQESLESVNQCSSVTGKTPVVRKKLQQESIQRKSWRRSGSCEGKDVTWSGIKWEWWWEWSHQAPEGQVQNIHREKRETTSPASSSQKLECMDSSRRLCSIYCKVHTAKELVKQKWILFDHKSETRQCISSRNFWSCAKFLWKWWSQLDHDRQKGFSFSFTIWAMTSCSEQASLRNLKESYRLFKETFPQRLFISSNLPNFIQSTAF